MREAKVDPPSLERENDSLKKRVRSLERERERAMDVISDLRWQVKAAVRARLSVDGLNSSELLGAISRGLRSGKGVNWFTDVAERWCAGLPIDPRSLKESVSQGFGSTLAKVNGATERAEAAYAAGEAETMASLSPLVGSLFAAMERALEDLERGREERESDATVEPPSLVSLRKRMVDITESLGHLQTMMDIGSGLGQRRG